MKLSDPFHDFGREMLGQLLDVPDEQLEWHHLQNLLGPFLPAGTYQESVYFLPFAFEFLHREENNALDVTTSVTWFISEYGDDLMRDGLLDECRSKIEGCLLHWTRDFTVEHFDNDGCAAKGWKSSYCDYVRRSEVICETLCDLERFIRHADLADRFITFLASSPMPARAGWFLELARAQYAADIRHPPARESFLSCFTDARLLARKRAIIVKHLAATTASSTYWRDVFSRLGLEALRGSEHL